MTGRHSGQVVYSLCLRAYPVAYRAEHGPDILATLADARGDGSFSPREAGALVVGGLRQRAVQARAGGPASTALSALRGACVAASLFTVLNLLFALPGAVFHAAVWVAPAGWTGRSSAGLSLLMLAVLGGIVVGSAALAGGRRRVAGLALLAATALMLTQPVDQGILYAGWPTALGLLVLGSSTRPRGRRRLAAVAAGCASAAVAGLFIGNVAIAPLTWMYLHETWLAAGLVGLGMVLAPLDGRLALGAAMAAAVEQGWSSLGTELKSLRWHTLLGQQDAAAVLVLAVVCALWGAIWIWQQGRSRRLASAV